MPRDRSKAKMDQKEFNTIIDWKYFSISQSWGNYGRPSKRTSRAEGFTSSQMSITHWLSGTVVIGKIANGNYSKNEMGNQKRLLEEFLLKEMHYMLAKYYFLKGMMFQKPTNEIFQMEYKKEKIESCIGYCKRKNIEEKTVLKYY